MRFLMDGQFIWDFFLHYYVISNFSLEHNWVISWAKTTIIYHVTLQLQRDLQLYISIITSINTDVFHALLHDTLFLQTFIYAVLCTECLVIIICLINDKLFDRLNNLFYLGDSLLQKMNKFVCWNIVGFKIHNRYT